MTHLLCQVDEVSLGSLLKFLGTAGGGTVLVFVTWAWFTRRVVTRGELEECKAARNEWKDLALSLRTDLNRNLNVSERAVSATEKAAEVVIKATGGNP